MGVLKVKLPNGVWENISGVTTNEVYSGPDDPRQGLYSNVILWFDTTLPAGERMKVWDAATSTWVTAVAVDSTKLPLAGGTLTGNLSFNATNGGVNFTGGSGIYDWTDKPLTLRESTGGGQPQIRDNGGGNARDIIDTINGDARYLQTAASTTHNVSWNTGWSGTCQYRVNPLMVTCHMVDVGYNGDSPEPWVFLMHYYPSGVPAPWANLRVAVNFIDASNTTWWDMGEVGFSTDGVWFRAFDNHSLGNAESFSCTCSWAR